jgi:hypothetical protein
MVIQHDSDESGKVGGSLEQKRQEGKAALSSFTFLPTVEL